MITLYVGVKEVHTQMYKVEVESLEALKENLSNVPNDENSEIQEDNFVYSHTLDSKTWDIYEGDKLVS